MLYVVPMPKTRTTLTALEVARRSGRSRATVTRAIRDGRLEATVVEGPRRVALYLIDEAAAEAYIAEARHELEERLAQIGAAS